MKDLTALKLLLDALVFASDKHKNQKRKGNSAIPYINHPIQVAQLLVSVGEITDIKILCAAILHDTVEDTDATHEDIQNLFGADIASIVAEVSDDKNLKKEERKRLQIVNAAKKSKAAKALKIADKTCNIRDIVNDPPVWKIERKLAYIEWAKAVVDEVRGVNPKLEQCFDEWVEKGMLKFYKE